MGRGCIGGLIGLEEEVLIADTKDLAHGEGKEGIAA